MTNKPNLTVITNTSHKAVIINCKTCAHLGKRFILDYCELHTEQPHFLSRIPPSCGWVQKPIKQKRSFRRWLYEMLWAF